MVLSKTADAAITQYRIVKVTSSGVDVSTADTDKILGVAKLTVAITEQCPVQISGTAKVTASAAISVGDYLTATTAGKAAATTTDKKRVIGIALEAAAADGDIIEVLLMPGFMTSL